MRLHAVAAVLALAGCIEPHLIPCGDLACVEGEQVCNLDDPEAPTCVPPANCGDRVIGYGEACDLDSLGGQTCESRGYYRGELSCTASCALEEVACAGRCGDGVLDVDNGELCDGFGGSCYDRGFDDGVMACSATCQPTTEACGRNGWRAVVQIDLPVSMAVAGGVVGVIDRPSAGAPMRTQIVRDGQAIAPPVANPTYAAVAAVRSTTAQPTAPALVFAAVDRID